MLSPAPQQCTLDASRALQLARETFDIEAAAVLGLRDRLEPAFPEAVQRMLSVRGRVVVMGMGKSGHVGRKMAATRTVPADALAVDAAQLMEQHRITSVLVLDAQGRLCGALNSNDLMRAKVI